MSFLTQAVAVSISLLLFACSTLDDTPPPSEQALSVTLTEVTQHIEHCRELGSVLAYGSFIAEAHNDLRHQAAVQYNANTVLLTSSKAFYQSTRLENYLRTPELKAPKGTANYYYKDAFTLKAIGSAYLCP